MSSGEEEPEKENLTSGEEARSEECGVARNHEGITKQNLTKEDQKRGAREEAMCWQNFTKEEQERSKRGSEVLAEFDERKEVGSVLEGSKTE